MLDVFATVDANKQYFDGAKTYKVTLPKGIPQAHLWEKRTDTITSFSFSETNHANTDNPTGHRHDGSGRTARLRCVRS